MTVNVLEAIKNPGVVYTASLEEDFAGFSYLGYDYRYVRPVKLWTDYSNTGRQIVFTGGFETSLGAQCSRCLAEVIHPVELAFEEAFSKTDPECYQFAGDTVSLDKVVEDTILLNLPGRFLCREDCKGLCPDCGADLNKHSCGCGGAAGVSGNPFAVLKQLLDDKEDE